MQLKQNDLLMAKNLRYYKKLTNTEFFWNSPPSWAQI